MLGSALLDDVICLRQHRGRNRDAHDQIDVQLKELAHETGVSLARPRPAILDHKVSALYITPIVSTVGGASGPLPRNPM